jgi:hypothetical protein
MMMMAFPTSAQQNVLYCLFAYVHSREHEVYGTREQGNRFDSRVSTRDIAVSL